LGRIQKQQPISEEYARIGKNLKRLRTFYDLTQEELSEELGISKVSVANYETGTRKIPLATLIKIAERFNVSIDNLVDLNVSYNGREHTIISNNPRMITAQEKWFQEVGVVDFSDDELQELINFAKYIVHKRNDK